MDLQPLKYITRRNYRTQITRDEPWRCPACGVKGCSFDDAYFELPYRHDVDHNVRGELITDAELKAASQDWGDDE